MSGADPWSGIPDDLRKLVTELLNASDPEALGYDPDRQDAAEAALCAALRALVADRERLDWLETRGYDVEVGQAFLWGAVYDKITLRKAIDAARGATPRGAQEDAE